jgi:phosphate ABC transporter permease subunit PstA/phosphate ABC transporter permease protein PstC
MKKIGLRLFDKIRVDDENPFKSPLKLSEKFISLLLFCSASIAVVVSAAIIYTLTEGSFTFFTDPLVNIIEFLTGTRWVPSGGNPLFGILPLISGTVLIAGGALLIGTPLGIAAAIFLSEFAGFKVRSIVKPIIEILAGIPSIVYGFFALMVVSNFFRDSFGASYFNAASAIIVIAIMILPIIISISDDAMKAVPNHLRETSLALGATRWETATKVVMPAASSGIIASVLLGLARAIGETMVVVLAAGSIARLTLNPLDEVMTMSAYIAKVATGDIPPGVAVSAGFAVGLVLFIITYLINMVAARIVLQIKEGATVKNKKVRLDKINIYAKISSIFSIIFVGFTIRVKRITHYIGAKLRILVSKNKYTLKRRYLRQRIGVSLLAMSIIIASLFLVVLLANVFSQGISGINVTFLTSFPSRFPEKAGIFPVIMGSVYLMVLTLVLSAPMGVGAAIYLNEFARDTRYTRFLRRIIQNLAGVPSIVFGLMGYTIFVRLFGFGQSILAGSLILTIMVLPIIVVATEEALKSVPFSFREAARGVGSTRWQTVRHHVLPNATPGILTGIILSLSRAIGETAPILFIVAYFSKSIPSGIFDGFMALPAQIFYWTTHPKAEFHTLAASSIIVLLLILFGMNAIAIIIRQRAQARRDW